MNDHQLITEYTVAVAVAAGQVLS